MHFAGGCVVTWSGGTAYGVTCTEGGHELVVDLSKRTCTCRKWDLTGIPCYHAAACINFKNDNWELYVNGCYKKDCYMKVLSLVFLLCFLDLFSIWACHMLYFLLGLSLAFLLSSLTDLQSHTRTYCGPWILGANSISKTSSTTYKATDWKAQEKEGQTQWHSNNWCRSNQTPKVQHSGTLHLL